MNPLTTTGCRLKPGAELTIPNTRDQHAMRPRLPDSRFRLYRMASPVSQAATWACSSVTSVPTLPRG